MAFFVVERSAVDSSLRIPLPEEFSTREAAIAALSAATTSGSVELTGEVFIADLSAAVPVLVMQAATPVVPAQSEVVDEIAEPVAEMDNAAAEEVYSSWESVEESPSVEALSLADALKRATSSLEGEGIVAPDSIEPERAPDLGEAEEEEVLTTDAGADAVMSEVAVVAEPASVSHDATDADKEAEWPWANVQAYEIPEAAIPEDAAEESDIGSVDTDSLSSVVAHDAEAAGAEEAPALADATEAATESLPDLAAELSALGLSDSELAPEEAPIITGAPPEGEDAYLPRPVILGDYADAEAETASDADAEAVDVTAVGDDSEGAIAEADSDEPGLEYVVQAVVEEEVGYASTGELDLAEYVCTDCVYSNTCPKVGQATPADCGSFQWKSE